MDLELEQYHKSNSALDLMISELRLKIDGMQREIDSLHTLAAESQGIVSRFRRDLDGSAVDDNKKLKSSIRALFSKYVQDEKSARVDPVMTLDPQMEFNRDREHMERNLDSLKARMVKDMQVLHSDHSKLVREGVNLTEEMNLLRREAKLLRRQHRSLDMETDNLIEGGGHSHAVSQIDISVDVQRELEIQEGQVISINYLSHRRHRPSKHQNFQISFLENRCRDLRVGNSTEFEP